MNDLERNKKIVKDIEGIVIRSSYFSFTSGHETHAIYEIQMTGDGRYEESDEHGKVLYEREFTVPLDEIEKLCIKIVDIMHCFDRVDLYYDDCYEEIELHFPGGPIIVPRGMGVKRRDVETAFRKFIKKNIAEQLSKNDPRDGNRKQGVL